MRVRKPTATLLICLFNPPSNSFRRCSFCSLAFEDLLPPYRDYFYSHFITNVNDYPCFLLFRTLDSPIRSLGSQLPLKGFPPKDFNFFPTNHGIHANDAPGICLNVSSKYWRASHSLTCDVEGDRTQRPLRFVRCYAISSPDPRMVYVTFMPGSLGNYAFLFDGFLSLLKTLGLRHKVRYR